jgi:hypothetical protein
MALGRRPLIGRLGLRGNNRRESTERSTPRHHERQRVIRIGGMVTDSAGKNFWRILGWIIVLVIVGFIVAGLWATTIVMPANS